jgi:hypothetical protein
VDPLAAVIVGLAWQISPTVSTSLRLKFLKFRYEDSRGLSLLEKPVSRFGRRLQGQKLGCAHASQRVIAQRDSSIGISNPHQDLLDIHIYQR